MTEIENLKDILRSLLKGPHWNLEDFIYEVRSQAMEDSPDYEGNSWDHPSVVLYSELLSRAEEALKD